jgi:hypothetical protein
LLPPTRVLLDELAALFDLVAHRRGEDLIGSTTSSMPTGARLRVDVVSLLGSSPSTAGAGSRPSPARCQRGASLPKNRLRAAPAAPPRSFADEPSCVLPRSAMRRYSAESNFAREPIARPGVLGTVPDDPCRTAVGAPARIAGSPGRNQAVAFGGWSQAAAVRQESRGRKFYFPRADACASSALSSSNAPARMMAFTSM